MSPGIYQIREVEIKTKGKKKKLNCSVEYFGPVEMM
jgi:hypothetical protein